MARYFTTHVFSFGWRSGVTFPLRGMPNPHWWRGVPVLHGREHYQVHGRLAIAGGAVQRGRASLHRHGALGRERGEKSRDVAKVVRQLGEQGSTTGVIARCAMDGRCVPDPKRGARSPADVESGGIRQHASGEIVLPGGSARYDDRRRCPVAGGKDT